MYNVTFTVIYKISRPYTFISDNNFLKNCLQKISQKNGIAMVNVVKK